MIVPDHTKPLLPETIQTELGPFQSLALSGDFMPRKLKKLIGYQVKQERALRFAKKRYDATPAVRTELLASPPDGQEPPRFDPQSDFGRLVMGAVLPVSRDRVVYTPAQLAQIADARHLQRAVAVRIQELEKAVAVKPAAGKTAAVKSAAELPQVVASTLIIQGAAGPAPRSSGAAEVAALTAADETASSSSGLSAPGAAPGASITSSTSHPGELPKKKRNRQNKKTADSLATVPPLSQPGDAPITASQA
jgi:hypothetical protein